MQKLVDWQFLGYSQIFFVSAILSCNLSFNNKPEKRNLKRCERYTYSLGIVGTLGFNKSCKDCLQKIGQKWCSNEIENK